MALVGLFLLLFLPLVVLLSLQGRGGNMMDYLPRWLRYGQEQEGGRENDGRTERKDENCSADDTETTPRAAPIASNISVPALVLEENGGEKNNNNNKQTRPNDNAESSSTFLNPGLSTTAEMPPPPRLSTGNPSSNSGSNNLMPPPARPSPRTQKQPIPSSSLLPPATPTNTTLKPLPNRGPPANSQQRAPSDSTSTNNNKPRGKKVLLAPGHSPIDWAILTKTLPQKYAGTGGIQRIPPSKLKLMTGRRGKPAWTSWRGKIYDLTEYLPFHPGGEAELLRAAGRDAEKLFVEVHPWVNFENMLGPCVVGVLVSETDYERVMLERRKAQHGTPGMLHGGDDGVVGESELESLD